MGTLPKTVEELSPQVAALLLAVCRSTQQWAPLTPCRSDTIEVLDLLKEHGLIEVPWPETAWRLPIKGYELPIEQLGWRYVWGAYPFASLSQALEDRLTEVAWHADMPVERLRLWEFLLASEAQGFLERQLEQHQFSPEWAQDLRWVMNRSEKMSLAKWRYVIWAAVRKGAAETQRVNSTPERVRKTIHDELEFRADKVASGAWGKAELIPKSNAPFNLAAQVLTLTVLPIAADYWTSVPSRWAAANSP